MVKAPKSLLILTRFDLVVIIPWGMNIFIIYSNPPQVSFENPSIRSTCIYRPLFLDFTLYAISFKLNILPVSKKMFSHGESRASSNRSKSFTAAITGLISIFFQKN